MVYIKPFKKDMRKLLRVMVSLYWTTLMKIDIQSIYFQHLNVNHMVLINIPQDCLLHFKMVMLTQYELIAMYYFLDVYKYYYYD